ncbi:MAG: GTP 3',8-cyclase MoaA [Ignisphaera sp.]|nr:GTP 3',8-cyclase MoaA [Ignisphaera sp.]MCX8167775.1 GTP 3',8-cyclase MoaA [Ignisphaera sp.]MDW8085238.1 GTP 3',8-cyclase MoaA [Ignisphaera sp.]
MLYDRFNRVLKNLRISVTYDCNFNCLYCHHEGWSNRSSDVLTAEEIQTVSSVARFLGIDEFKLTGGEPLLRKDIVKIVSALRELKPRDISITTNGFLLEKLVGPLSEAGLMRLNVNLPTLSREKYRMITGVDGLENVLKGIEAAHNYKLPITLNVVLLNGINNEEYKELINFAQRYEAKIRFIELEPIMVDMEMYKRLYASANKIIEYLEATSVFKTYRELNRRPIYTISNGIRVEVVKWLGNRYFCSYCNRIRLSPSGILKPCIMVEYGIDLKPFLRPTTNYNELKNAFINVNQMRIPYNMIHHRDTGGINTRIDRSIQSH